MPTPRNDTPTRAVAVAAALLVLYLVWGSTYLGIALAIQSIPPFLMAASRFFVAGAVLLVWSRARAGSSFAWPTRREWRDSAIVGALLLGGGMGLVAFGELTIPSGIAAILIAMMPVWVAVLGRAFLGERLPGLAMIGVAVGFVGVAVLAGPTALGQTGALDPLALLALIVSPIAWALGSLFSSHRAVLPRHALTATAAQMITGGVALTIMSGVAGEFGRFDVAAVTTTSLGALVYLTLIGSLLAFTTFGWLVRVAPLSLVTTYAYVNPVVAVALGAIVLGEPIEPRTVLAGAIIVGAVAVIVTARGRMRRPAPRPADHGQAASPAAIDPAASPSIAAAKPT